MDKNKFISYLKEEKKKYIIFDFDETLCTLLIDWSVWVKEFQELFLFYDNKKIEKDFAPEQNKYIKKYGEEIREKMLNINYQNEKNFYSGYKTNDKVLSILPDLRNFFWLYMWTSNDRRTVMPVIDELRIEKFFKKIITRNDVKCIKPEPDGFYLIYNTTHLKSEYLMIGDSTADSGAAKKAGIDFMHIKEIV